MNQTTIFLERVYQFYLDPHIVYIIGLCVPVGFYYTLHYYPEWQMRYGLNILSEREYQIGATLLSSVAFLPIFWVTDFDDYGLGIWTVLLNLIGIRVLHNILYFLTLRRQEQAVD